MSHEHDWTYDEEEEEFDGPLTDGEAEDLEGEIREVEETAPLSLPEEHKPLSPRHKVFCRMIAYGNRNTDVARKLGYTDAWVSTLKNHYRIKREIERIQDLIFEESAADRIKSLAPRALDVFEEALTSDEGKWTPTHKMQAATWIAEKHSGKAIQQIETKDTTLSSFLDKLKSLQESGKGLRDLSPSNPNALSLKGASPKDSEALTTEAEYEDVSQEEKVEEVHPADLFAAQFFRGEGESK